MIEISIFFFFVFLFTTKIFFLYKLNREKRFSIYLSIIESVFPAFFKKKLIALSITPIYYYFNLNLETKLTQYNIILINK